MDALPMNSDETDEPILVCEVDVGDGKRARIVRTEPECYLLEVLHDHDLLGVPQWRLVDPEGKDSFMVYEDALCALLESLWQIGALRPGITVR